MWKECKTRSLQGVYDYTIKGVDMKGRQPVTLEEWKGTEGKCGKNAWNGACKARKECSDRYKWRLLLWPSP